MPVNVIKYSGEKEPYSEEKIRASATRVGVPRALQDAMLEEIRTKLYDDIKTAEIYDIIKSYLARSDQPHLSAKYDLREALADLGPSGYPFEQYLAILLGELGYHTKTNQVMQGQCVSHEVDVVAVKDGTTHLVEAKFHKRPHQRTDIKVALYIRARYEDLAAATNADTAPWIITNTRFSSDAIAYGKCQGIKLTSWGYPRDEGIMDLIEQVGLHPITILDTLTKEDKRTLLSQGIVACRQLLGNKQDAALIPSSRRGQVLSQARVICQSQ
jgi:HJR/Mrr/RecB family endonuclease